MKTKTLILASLVISLAFLAAMPSAAAEDCVISQWSVPCTPRCILNGEDDPVGCVLRPYQCPPMC